MSRSLSDRVGVAIAIALASLGLLACEGDTCVRQSDCTTGFSCQLGHCRSTTDAAGEDGATAADAGNDAGRTTDAGASDAASDAARDAGRDTGTDAGS